MGKQPKVSVIMPCYNHEKYVGQAIESVLNQTYENIELIVADNGSTDNSYEQIIKYQDGIAKLFRLEQNDLYECTCILNAAAEGDYIAWMTSDDVWESQKIEFQMQAFLGNSNVKACATFATVMDEDLENEIEEASCRFKEGNRTREEWLKRLIVGGNCLAWPSCVVERETYFNTQSRGYRQLGDLFYWIQFLFQGDLYVVPKELVKFRYHPCGTNKNESAPTIEGRVRTQNEGADILNYTVEHMSDELFLDAFREYLVNPNAVDSVQVTCEKLFFLQKLAERDIDMLPTVLRYYYDHIEFPTSASTNQGSFSDVLSKAYGYTSRDFWRWSEKACLSQQEKDFARYRSFAENEIRKKDKQIHGLKACLMGMMEKDKIRKVLYRSQPPTTKRILHEVEKLTNVLVGRIENLDCENMSAYYDLVKLLQTLSDWLEEVRDDLAYMECGVSEDEWNLFEELVQIAEEKQIDLREAVLPFLEEFVGKLHQVRMID